MSIRSLICFIATAAIVTTSFSTDALYAQRNKPTWNGLTRFLGGGHSAGYHWRTPGPDVSYYNPYSRVNSTLRIGGVPQGAEPYVGRYGSQHGCGQSFDGQSFDQPSGFGDYSQGQFLQQPTAYPTQYAPSSTTIDAEIDDSEDTLDAEGTESILDDPTSGIDSGSSTRNVPDGDTRSVPGSDTRSIPDSTPRSTPGSGTRSTPEGVDETSQWPGFFEFGSTAPRQQYQHQTTYSQPTAGRPIQYRASQAPAQAQAPQRPIFDRRGSLSNQRFK